jgi:hypothetical protein
MQYEYNPSFDDPPIDHAAYRDPRVLDRSEPYAILSPYPELWRYWQAEMDSPGAYSEYCSGGIYRMHDPRYLRDVVRQYVFLRETGDPPMPAVFAERMATLLASAPDYAEVRNAFLTSPWERALKRWDIRAYYLPDYVERDIGYWNESKDPFSESSIRYNKVIDAIFGPAAVEIKDVDSGQVVARRDGGEPPRHTMAPRN